MDTPQEIPGRIRDLRAVPLTELVKRPATQRKASAPGEFNSSI